MVNEKIRKLSVLQVRHAIAATRMSFWEISKALEITEKTLRHWWQGKTCPTLWHFRALEELGYERDCGAGDKSASGHGREITGLFITRKKKANQLICLLFI